VAAVVINAEYSASNSPVFLIYRNRLILDSFQCFSIISLELLQNTAFPFASGRALKYPYGCITQGFFWFHDRLFLQRPERPRCPQCRECSWGPAATSEADLWLPWLQRRVRPMRAHDQDHYR
jgi:hypothetical protein